MKVYGEIELSGITKIVVNRTVVWEREGEIWVKKAGGAKFIYNEDYRIIKLPHQMMYHINRLLARNVKDPVLEMIGIEENAYKAWPSGNTLNVCRKDLIKKD
jgi:hypothetical protein